MKLRHIVFVLVATGLGRAAAADSAATPSAPASTVPAPVTTNPGQKIPEAAAAPSGTAAASSPAMVEPTPARPEPAKPSTAGVATAPAASVRTDPMVAPAASFDSFRLVSERNIFNPNRTGRRDRSTEEKVLRLDVISLVGTMDSDRGLRAFFDGSNSNYRRAIRVGESVDKFKVTQIAANVVALEGEGKTLSLQVGEQLRRPEGAEWVLIGEDVARREAQARAAAEAKVDPSAPPVIPAGASEIEKRMMNRRLNDLKK